MNNAYKETTLDSSLLERYTPILLLGGIEQKELDFYRRLMAHAIKDQQKNIIPERGQSRLRLAQSLDVTPQRITAGIIQLRWLTAYDNAPENFTGPLSPTPYHKLIRVARQHDIPMKPAFDSKQHEESCDEKKHVPELEEGMSDYNALVAENLTLKNELKRLRNFYSCICNLVEIQGT